MTRNQLITLLKNPETRPEQLFVAVSKKEKNTLALLVHPDHFHSPDANMLTERLFQLYASAEVRKVNKVFGSMFKFDKPVKMASNKHKFELVSKFGDTQSFMVFEKADGGLLFITKNNKENINGKNHNEVIRKFSTGKFKAPAGYSELVSAGKYSDGRDLYELDTLKGYYPLSRFVGRGVPVRHLAWMFNRIVLQILHLVVRNSIHTNINPSTVLVNPTDHTAVLIGLESIVPETIKKAQREITTSFMPPEQQKSGDINSSTDLYAFARIVETLASSSWTNQERDVLEPVIRTFTGLAAPFRTVSIDDLEKRLKEIWGSLYGEPKWQDFFKLNIPII